MANPGVLTENLLDSDDQAAIYKKMAVSLVAASPYDRMFHDVLTDLHGKESADVDAVLADGKFA